MEKIKLVIWDLDETFWRGTLSEEGIGIIQENIELVKTLTDRGIINSIVSKNDFEQAKNKLEELGIWDLFVFPAIEWAPKGVLIKNIIENCQLRDTNTLFLDDNHLNLEEAKFYNKNLHTQFPDFIPEILDHKAFKGKDDRTHSRLKQYKILEEKNEAKQDFSDNLEFLKSSNIQLKEISDLSNHLDRVYELTERTNQLNFTKIRPSIQEVKELITDQEYKSGLIHVKDNFGDYGIVGFYSIHKESNELIHFVFSCRILNLGVAQYMYSKLGFLPLKIVPEVAETLDTSTPDWITEISESTPIIPTNKLTTNPKKTKILFKGGCDLGQMLFYLKGKEFDIQEETNYVTKDNISIHQEHSQVLLDSQQLSSTQKDWVTSTPIIPFADKNFYQTEVFNSDYQVLVYSVLMDYTQDLYYHKETGITIPVGGYSSKWTEPKDHKKLIDTFNSKLINQDVLTQFADNFECLGQISPKEFKQNLKNLRQKVDNQIPLVFINGAEIEPRISNEKGAKERHKLMNSTLDEFIADSENTYLVDIRTIITSIDQLGNNIRHYNRSVYQQISSKLLELLQMHIDQRISTKMSLKKKILTKVPIVIRAIEKNRIFTKELAYFSDIKYVNKQRNISGVL